MLKKERWLYLDLEETVIDSWNDRLIIRPGALINAVKSIAPTHLGIFSFAIANDHDREDYYRNIDPLVANLAGRGADRVVTIGELIGIAREQRSVHFAGTSDYLDANTKEMAFLAFAAAAHSNCELVLLDDAVPDLAIDQLDTGNRIAIVDVRHADTWSLPGWVSGVGRARSLDTSHTPAAKTA